MPCGDLDGQSGGMGGRSKREEIIYMHMTDSLHCIAETTITLESNFTPILKNAA